MADALDKQEQVQALEAGEAATDEQADEQAELDAHDTDAGDGAGNGAGEADDAGDSGASAPADMAADDAVDAHDATADAESDSAGDVTARTAADAAAEAEIAATVEAILFSTDSSLSAAKIALVAELPNRGLVKRAVAQLNERYERMGCSFCVESIAGGYQMLTRPQYHDVVSRLFKNKSDSKLSQAAMETLAIVAYRQPILRADIEAVRGVASGEMLRGLMEKNLVKIVGRAEVLGRPMLYGTTRQFLEVFGLNSIDDLPNVESLRGGRDANANAKKAAAAAQAGDQAGAEQPAAGDDAETQAGAKAQTQSQPTPPEEPSTPPREDSDPPPEAL